METRIAIFRQKKIRKTVHNNEWWFVVEDVVLGLIDSKDPKQYIQRMRLRDPELNKGWVQIVHTLAIDNLENFEIKSSVFEKLRKNGLLQ